MDNTLPLLRLRGIAKSGGPVQALTGTVYQIPRS
jgi:hypothetical protein